MGAEIKEFKAEFEGIVEKLEGKYAALAEKHRKLGDEAREVIKQLVGLKEGSEDWKELKSQIDKDYGKPLCDMQRELNDVKASVEFIRMGRADVARGLGSSVVQAAMRSVERKSIDRAIIEEKRFADEINGVGEVAFDRKLRQCFVGSVLGGIEEKYASVAEEQIKKHHAEMVKKGKIPKVEQKASDLMDPTGDLQAEFDDMSNVIASPKRAPVHRRLFRVIPMAGYKSADLRIELRQIEYVCKATANASSGQPAIVVDRIAGILIDSDYDDVTVLGTNGTESHTVLSIAATSAEDPNGPGTITLAANLANNVVAGDLIAFQNPGYIAAAAKSPRARISFDKITVTMRAVRAHTKYSKEETMWAPLLMQRFEEELVQKLARDEEWQIFYGDNTTGQYDGIFADTGVTDIVWNTQVPGTTRLDCVEIGRSAIEDLDYIPEWLLVKPSENSKLIRSKGENGQYVYMQAAMAGDEPRMFSLLVEKSTVMPSDKGLIGNRDSLWIFDGMQTDVETARGGDELIDGTYVTAAEMYSASYPAHPSSFALIDWSGGAPS